MGSVPSPKILRQGSSFSPIRLEPKAQALPAGAQDKIPSYDCSNFLGTMGASNQNSNPSYAYTDARSGCPCEELFPPDSCYFAPWLATTRCSDRQCTVITSQISNGYRRPLQKNFPSHGGKEGQRQPVLPLQNPSKSQHPPVPAEDQTTPVPTSGCISTQSTTPGNLPTNILSTSDNTAMTDSAYTPTSIAIPTRTTTTTSTPYCPRMDFAGFGQR
ncbi:hypothetical protein EV426DRAFT_645698 [Tirmania nivea]|nr:hypothetical protein EV426DRAFT_645698 [Tirmania nivea]